MVWSVMNFILHFPLQNSQFTPHFALRHSQFNPHFVIPNLLPTSHFEIPNLLPTSHFVIPNLTPTSSFPIYSPLRHTQSLYHNRTPLAQHIRPPWIRHLHAIGQFNFYFGKMRKGIWCMNLGRHFRFFYLPWYCL